MIEVLKKLNTGLEIYDVNEKEFSSFGRVIKGLDVSEISEAAVKIPHPESGSSYVPSVADFEKLSIASVIKNELFGTLPTQIGYCYGHNNLMNATEWHTSSEINIAISPIVLILGHVWEIENNTIDSSKFKAFYLPRGTVVEVYSTTLHYCPCEVDKAGFGSVVALPLGTNTELTHKVENKLLFCKNKWLISHMDNSDLIERGAIAGITGENFEIKY